MDRQWELGYVAAKLYLITGIWVPVPTKQAKATD
jgi:hypothetical protein